MREQVKPIPEQPHRRQIVALTFKLSGTSSSRVRLLGDFGSSKMLCTRLVELLGTEFPLDLITLRVRIRQRRGKDYVPDRGASGLAVL